VLESHHQTLDHTPIPLIDFIDFLGKPGSTADLREFLNSSRKTNIRKVWPTFYHLAMEDFHPGKKVPVLDVAGKIIGHASNEFLQQVRWEGSGVALDGTKYHYSGRPGRYEKYNLRWGFGAGYNYQVFAYRTIAVNFAGLCRHLPQIRGCNKARLIGLLVYIPEIADRKIRMPGGEVHDGYFCITDTGSPYYIREDRIDMFVGTHGGGNPYLPAQRQGNAFIEGGIKNLVPSDWQVWTEDNKRVWCDLSLAEAGKCTIDYRNTAPEKALTIQAVFDPQGAPVRCKKNP
ncbi:MAG: hypothetical protein KDK37_06065, partial [Leptospiraceae bacterium]|nr:hypothetical protein [Leptospiraceae bacterium]